jgi:manganese efflux pump family protein
MGCASPKQLFTAIISRHYNVDVGLCFDRWVRQGGPSSAFPAKNAGALMDLITITLIAVGLSMDALAVSIAKGMSVTSNRWKPALLLAGLFGIFQALMPVIGWLLGLGFADLIMGVDHWIAFGLLGFIGGKMILDGFKDEKEEDGRLTMPIALTLAVATSIDALMVGVSFAFLETSILLPIAIIGLITFVLSLLGFVFGSRLGKVFGSRIEIVGGIILIAIGLRILIEHLTA